MISVTGRPEGCGAWHDVGRVVLVLGLALSPLFAGDDGDTTARAPGAVDGAPAIAGPAREGLPGIGDEDFPGLGNGGYDALHYDLQLEVGVVGHTLEGVATITVRALHGLKSFHLDLWELTVREVLVDGVVAGVAHEGAELRVTPDVPVPAGATFEVVVRYGGTPRGVPSVAVPFVEGIGWTPTEGGVYVVSEPGGAASLFPCNDHPLDKATYSFAITTQRPYVAVANGLPGEVSQDGERRTFHWRASDPMASYLVTVAVAELEHVASEGPGGLPIHDYFHVSTPAEARAAFERVPEMIAFFEQRFGSYPFESYGGIVAHAPIPGALETQTRPVFGVRATGESTLAHELAHQWFGNHVSPARWRDVWLNEGFAVYGAWLWKAHSQGQSALRREVARAEAMVRKFKVGSPATPAPEALFGAAVYGRGPLVLHRLRQHLGDDRFFALLRAYIERFGGGHASTTGLLDLILAREGEEAHAVADKALYAPVLPPLRGEGKSQSTDDP